MAKKDFVQKLIKLAPRLHNTGEVPTEQTIYRYLNGTRELKVELIPYIATILEVSENELFTYDMIYSSSYNLNSSREIREIYQMLSFAPLSVISKIHLLLEKYKKLNEEANKILN
jgi:transcriptional regulator with XRE-family HTH domain